MEPRRRHRPSLRRATMTVGVAALLAPAMAGVAPDAHAAKRVKPPVITRVAPKAVAVGQVLEVRGRHFARGRLKNTVVFKRDGAKAVFVKAGIGTTKLLRVVVPARLKGVMAVRDGQPVATRFRLRVLAKRLGRRFTRGALSPMVGPEAPPAPKRPPVDPDGDCDSDGQPNRTDADDDNDLLADATELGLRYPTDPCKLDTDGDGAGDGYEYRSARDLNNDEYQSPNAFLPYPGKKPYANPLDPTDRDTDFDGDGLTLIEEHALWRFTLASGAPSPTPAALEAPAAALSYSDGTKYSVYQQAAGDDRRQPALAAAGYDKEAAFQSWLHVSGYWNVLRPDDGVSTPILDVDRDGSVSTAESHYLDRHHLGWLSDDERDEDADGLSNWDETHGRMRSAWWKSKYSRETPFRITYADTAVDDPDSDGDGVLDGADDQDHDDVPNIVELSRQAVTHRPLDREDVDAETWPVPNRDPVYGRVQPFNPCEPFIDSRTCPDFIPFGGTTWAPFDGPPWAPEGGDPNYLVLN